MIKVKKLNSQAITGQWAIKVNTISGRKIAFASKNIISGLFDAIIVLFTY